MKTPQTEELQRHIGQLFSESLRVSKPVGSLHLIREQINAKSYHNFYKEDILLELGQLQNIMGKLHTEMLSINDLLKQL